MKLTVFLIFTLQILLTACGDSDESKDTSVVIPTSIIEADTLFVFIEGGTFITGVGDTVEIADFRISRYEVTNRLYLFLANKAGIDLPPDPTFAGIENYLFDYPNYPAVNVSAFDAMNAAEAGGWRLPTDAEWEYAISRTAGVDQDEFPWGELMPEDADYPANYLAGGEWETRDIDGYLWTAPVDAYPLTDNGLACFAGNAAEWTIGADSLFYVRGGSWVSPVSKLRIGVRTEHHPGDRMWSVGFRLAESVVN